MRLLYVYKLNPQDPTELALRKWFERKMPHVRFFDFRPGERDRKTISDTEPLRRLQETIEREEPTHIFCWVSYLNLAELKWIKARGLHVSTGVNGATSLTNGIITDQQAYFDYLRLLDCYFVPHAPHVPLLKEQGIRAYELPFCFDHEIYRPLNAWQKLWDTVKYDSIYIGNFGDGNNAQGTYRAQVVSALAKRGSMLLVSGRSYLDYGLKMDSIRRLGTITNPSILNWLINLSKVSIGTDYFPNIEDYHRSVYTGVTVPYELTRDGYVMRPRTFWSMGAGSPFLVERYSEMERFFKDDEEVILWGTLAEAEEKLRHYLANPSELMRITERGQRKAVALHSAEVRVSQILRILGGHAEPLFAEGVPK